MSRTRKWALVEQEAKRLAALGLTPKEIADRLEVNKSTVTRWIAAGKLIGAVTGTRRQTVGAPDVDVKAGQSPEEWAASIRRTYDLDVTDEQLLTIAQMSLTMQRDPKLPAMVRLAASNRFQSLVKQLALVVKQPEAPAPAPPPPEPARREPVMRRPGADPRMVLVN